jgi:hypothetical protein
LFLSAAKALARPPPSFLLRRVLLLEKVVKTSLGEPVKMDFASLPLPAVLFVEIFNDDDDEDKCCTGSGVCIIIIIIFI